MTWLGVPPPDEPRNPLAAKYCRDCKAAGLDNCAACDPSTIHVLQGAAHG